MESISRLREICQYTRYDKFNQSDWLDRNIFRKVSIYLTRFFIKLGISPNRLTLLSLLPGTAAGALFAFPQAEYWLVAWSLLFIYEILDCCDGEVARYQGSVSLIGEHNDSIIGIAFIYPFLLACMYFGIYRALENTIAFIFGFALVIGWTVSCCSALLCQRILCKKGTLQEQLEGIEQVDIPDIMSRGIIRYCRMPFTRTALFLPYS